MRIPALILLAASVSCGAPIVQGGEVSVVPAAGTQAGLSAEPSTSTDDAPAKYTGRTRNQPSTPALMPSVPTISDGVEVFTQGTVPSSIAVLAVEDATNRRRVPTDFLRTTLTSALMDRGFTPLGREYVDIQVRVGSGNTSEVRIPGAAVLSFQILEWEGKHIERKGRLQMSGVLAVHGLQGELLHQIRIDFKGALSITQLSSMTPRKRNSALIGQLVEVLFASFPEPPPL
ncbi:MAG TPA: hypothetical protein DDW23_08665 [Planctomycetes bacterium]|nr:hypothetical protein [Planctomycetota bacterium]